MNTHIERSAEISDCGMYRWWLRRTWQVVNGKGTCCFIMLNPSTADGNVDDPTIRRCIGFAKTWGYGTLMVRNLFPWRATDPAVLRGKTKSMITGGHRGDIELMSAMSSDLVVAAWGADVPGFRDIDAKAIFRKHPEKVIHCLGTTKHGCPRHPLYVRADQLPLVYRVDQ